MKVYAIELYDDHEVVNQIMNKAFTSYRNASEYLLKNGYDVYVEENDYYDGWELFFEKEIWHKTKWYMENKITASVVELEVIE